MSAILSRSRSKFRSPDASSPLDPRDACRPLSISLEVPICPADSRYVCKPLSISLEVQKSRYEQSSRPNRCLQVYIDLDRSLEVPIRAVQQTLEMSASLSRCRSKPRSPDAKYED
ncbi:hypothetical protein AVEN_64282-1 [Araneus ventricosus]|uniref:Uncharacterized protein n=1 Tax=Araneus ventricosus TaxID=182803 RepID=A0A4Y2R955_ARAVE|nr:hypothetical protein AVEN_64282-1 [Araneus ventricosus]